LSELRNLRITHSYTSANDQMLFAPCNRLTVCRSHLLYGYLQNNSEVSCEQFQRKSRIFYYNSWESVKALQFCCGRLDFCHIYVKRKLTFLRALCELDNLVVRTCFSVFNWSQKCRELSSAFNCIIDVLRRGSRNFGKGAR